MFHLNRTYFIKFQTVFLIIQQTSVINFSHIIFKQTQKSRCLAFICKTQLPLWNQIKMNSGMKLRPYENKNKTSKQTKKNMLLILFLQIVSLIIYIFFLASGKIYTSFPTILSQLTYSLGFCRGKKKTKRKITNLHDLVLWFIPMRWIGYIY